MINKTIILLTVMLLLISCSVNKKITKLIEGGDVQQKTFKVDIPFEYRFGLVVIKVELNNETYDFVIDSGAPNVLSKELAETLGLKGLVTINNMPDAQRTNQPMDITKLEGLTIGGIKFKGTGAVIGDFNQSVEVGCLDIDGILGANLMRLAVWKIDYRNQIITISNTKENLVLEAGTKRIPFYTDLANTPYCTIKINGIEEKNVMIDLGASMGFNLSSKTYDKIQSEVSEHKKVTQIGYGGHGFHGYGKIDSIYYLQANELSAGQIRLNKQVIRFSQNSTPLIGTAFFKNYDLVMNWDDKELLLSPHTVYDNQKFTHKGIDFNYKDGALRIAALFKESAAEKSGIQLGDKIIQIDGKDYSNTTIADYCELIKQVYKDNSIKNVKNVVINRKGERLSFDIKNDVTIE